MNSKSRSNRRLPVKKLTVIGMAGALMLVLAAPAFAAKPSWAQAAKPGNESIVDIASGNADFEVLVAAVSRAGLVPMLDGKGEFTVFAPTDGAFEATFGATEAQIIALINAGALDDQLADILGYHVTAGRRTSNSVLASSTYKMLNGDKLTKSELVAAGVSPADISASNGIIHVLTEGVLLP
jgi:uncharacterized surface protein with fasciclin (FAS1) repeats